MVINISSLPIMHHTIITLVVLNTSIGITVASLRACSPPTPILALPCANLAEVNFYSRLSHVLRAQLSPVAGTSLTSPSPLVSVADMDWIVFESLVHTWSLAWGDQAKLALVSDHLREFAARRSPEYMGELLRRYDTRLLSLRRHSLDRVATAVHAQMSESRGAYSAQSDVLSAVRDAHVAAQAAMADFNFRFGILRRAALAYHTTESPIEHHRNRVVHYSIAFRELLKELAGAPALRVAAGIRRVLRWMETVPVANKIQPGSRWEMLQSGLRKYLDPEPFVKAVEATAAARAHAVERMRLIENEWRVLKAELAEVHAEIDFL